MLIVDSQVHIWDNRKLPPHHRQVMTFGKDDLLAEMDAAGVDAAIICPPFMLPEVNELACEAAREHPDRLAVMGFFPIDKPESREVIKTWRERPGSVGLRWVLNQPHHKQWWADGTMDWVWAAAEKEGLPVALHAADALPEIGKVADRHPDLKLAVDHMGTPSASKDEASFVHLDQLLALAKRPNVSVKLSGSAMNSTADYPWRNIHGQIRRMFDAFGPERCFWGTDITRMHPTYRQCVTMFTEEMDWLKGRDLELVMGRAMLEWLGWDGPKAKA